MRIAVLGAGAWGTALAIAFARRHQVTLWARNRDQVEAMAAKRENTRYLKDCPFPDELRLQVDYRQAISDADLLIIASPLSGLRDSLVQLRDVQQVTPFLWVCKGLEATTGLLPHQVVAEVLGDKVSCGVLTGPSFALELARGLPTVVTLASTDETFALATAKQLHGGKLRVYATDDVIGAEIGGAVKNVMAIATGISDGMNLGANCRAALLTRGLAEITPLRRCAGRQSGDIYRAFRHGRPLSHMHRRPVAESSCRLVAGLRNGNSGHKNTTRTCR